MLFRTLLATLLFAMLPILAKADCVDLSTATSYVVSNYHNILLYSANNPIALVRTFSFIYNGSDLQLIKHGFVCSYDSSVFLLDGNEIVDVNEVKSL